MEIFLVILVISEHFVNNVIYMIQEVKVHSQLSVDIHVEHVKINTRI